MEANDVNRVTEVEKWDGVMNPLAQVQMLTAVARMESSRLG